MNGIVTTDTFEQTLDVGFNLPQTLLRPNTAEQVTVITVAPGQRLQLRWLTLHLVKLNSSATQIPTKVNASLGTFYVGLFGDRADFIRAPAGRPLLYAAVELPGAAQERPAFAINLSPGTYSMLAVNNLFGVTIEAAICGSFRLNLP